MSIAITAVIQVSRFFAYLLSLMNCMVLLSMVWSLMILRGSIYFYYASVVLCCACILLIRLQWIYWRRLTVYRLEITNKGDMLVRYQSKHHLTLSDQAQVVDLLPQTVLWSFFMGLVFKTSTGEIIFIPVFFDSVKRDTFRQLSVALRWVSVRSLKEKSLKENAIKGE